VLFVRDGQALKKHRQPKKPVFHSGEK